MDQSALANLIIRHSLASERYSQTVADKIVHLLNSADEEIVAEIASRYALIQQRGYDRGPATTKRLEDMLEALRAINTEVYSKVHTALSDDLVTLAEYEAQWINGAIKTAGGTVSPSSLTPSPQFLKTLVETSPIATGNDGAAVLQSWIDRMEEGRLARCDEAIRMSLVRGETTDQVVRKIAGTRAKRYQDGILNISRHSAKTLALTANATVQSAARMETYKASRTIKYVEWSTVLDGRTSKGCQALSGTIYKIGEPHPTTPRHPRCRSILIPRRNDTDPPLHKTYAQWRAEQSDDVDDTSSLTLAQLKAKDRQDK